MALIYANTKLCELISHEPAIIPVINRFGIKLGTGDATIASICNERELDLEFFLAILNTFINEEYFPEKIMKSFCASSIIEYLQKTNISYLKYHLPNIDRHFGLLIDRSGGDNNLSLILKFYAELRQDITDRINNDTSSWFPLIAKLEKENNITTSSPIIPTENDPIEDKLHDLKNMFIIHLSGSYDENLCYAVIVSILSLEKDIKQNNRIRNRILTPLAHNLQQSIG